MLCTCLVLVVIAIGLVFGFGVFKHGFHKIKDTVSFCDSCGHEELNMNECPVCGSKDITKIDRMNGYLSYSRVKGESRLNEAKMSEIDDRVSM